MSNYGGISMQFTTEQQQAINTKDCNVLVAAGAGSRQNSCTC